MKAVNELLNATGGRPANIQGYHAGSVVCLEPNSPDFTKWENRQTRILPWFGTSSANCAVTTEDSVRR